MTYVCGREPAYHCEFGRERKACLSEARLGVALTTHSDAALLGHRVPGAHRPWRPLLRLSPEEGSFGVKISARFETSAEWFLERRILRDEPAALTAPLALERIVRRCLRKRPDDRIGCRPDWSAVGADVAVITDVGRVTTPGTLTRNAPRLSLSSSSFTPSKS